MPKAVWLDELQSFLEVFDYIKGSMSFPLIQGLSPNNPPTIMTHGPMAGHLARLESIEELSDESRSAKSDGPGSGTVQLTGYPVGPGFSPDGLMD